MNIEDLLNYLNKNRKKINIRLLKLVDSKDICTFFFEVRFTQRLKFYIDIEYDKIDNFNNLDLEYFKSIIDNRILKEL